MTGWVRVSRAIFEHELFAQEPMSEREAWLWLVTKAAWKDTQHRVGGVVHDVPRGSLFATLRELQAAWKWGSDGRVRRFLDLLENQRMIQRSSDAGKTRITICNYSKFQDTERAHDAAVTAQTTQPRRTDDALKEQGNKIEDTRLLSERAPPTRSELDGLEGRLRQAANAENNPSPGLFDLSPIIACMNAGATLDGDVIPQIRAITARGHRWRTWGYASNAIMDAKARRESAAPQGEVAPMARGQPPPAKPASMNRRVLDALDEMDLSNVFASHPETGPKRLPSPVYSIRDG